MNKITQTMLYRQSLILYAKKHGVTKSVIHCRTNRHYVLKRYDGSLHFLADKSYKPHHPNQHTKQELTLIYNMRRSNPNTGLISFWVKLR